MLLKTIKKSAAFGLLFLNVSNNVAPKPHIYRKGKSDRYHIHFVKFYRRVFQKISGALMSGKQALNIEVKQRNIKGKSKTSFWCRYR